MYHLVPSDVFGTNPILVSATSFCQKGLVLFQPCPLYCTWMEIVPSVSSSSPVYVRSDIDVGSRGGPLCHVFLYVSSLTMDTAAPSCGAAPTWRVTHTHIGNCYTVCMVIMTGVDCNEHKPVYTITPKIDSRPTHAHGN